MSGDGCGCHDFWEGDLPEDACGCACHQDTGDDPAGRAMAVAWFHGPRDMPLDEDGT